MVTVFDHPLITHKLAQMRDENTKTKDFRELLGEIGQLMVYEVLRDCPTRPITVKTPVGICETKTLDKEIVLCPVLRAGLGWLDAIHELVPTAKVGFVGMYRDAKTHEPHEYFAKYPDMSDAIVLVLEPMVATGGSTIAAVNSIKEHGGKNIRMVSLVAAPEGVKALQTAHPDVDIYVAALDEKLNENAYIVPGLGDAGDRIFGTK